MEGSASSARGAEFTNRKFGIIGREGAEGPGGQGAYRSKAETNRGVSETALQGAQIHWKKRNFTVGPWGSSKGSHTGGGRGSGIRGGE